MMCQTNLNVKGHHLLQLTDRFLKRLKPVCRKLRTEEFVNLKEIKGELEFSYIKSFQLPRKKYETKYILEFLRALFFKWRRIFWREKPLHCGKERGGEGGIKEKERWNLMRIWRNLYKVFFFLFLLLPFSTPQILKNFKLSK
jgi:hypothetical protein